MIGIQDLLLNAKDIPITIPASAAGQQNATATVQFNLADEINKQNTSGYPLSASNIKSATVNAVSIDITSGASVNNNFANFTDGGVLLVSDANANTQQKATLGQILGNPDAYTTHLDLPISGTTDLTEYLKGTNFTYTYAFLLRRATTATLQCVIHVKYDVKIQP
ncbi:MAG TPA: hypothetical protein VIM07_13050 [Chitinophagaceae bacterium]